MVSKKKKSLLLKPKLSYNKYKKLTADTVLVIIKRLNMDSRLKAKMSKLRLNHLNIGKETHLPEL